MPREKCIVSNRECAQYTIRYGRVWTVVTVGASGLEFQSFKHCARDEHEVREHLSSRSNIARPHSLFKVQHLKSLGFVSTKLLSWHFIADRKQCYSAEPLPHRGSILSCRKSFPKVTQYVQSVKNTRVQ